MHTYKGKIRHACPPPSLPNYIKRHSKTKGKPKNTARLRHPGISQNTSLSVSFDFRKPCSWGALNAVGWKMAPSEAFIYLSNQRDGHFGGKMEWRGEKTRLNGLKEDIFCQSYVSMEVHRSQTLWLGQNGRGMRSEKQMQRPTKKSSFLLLGGWRSSYNSSNNSTASFSFRDLLQIHKPPFAPQVRLVDSAQPCGQIQWHHRPPPPMHQIICDKP